ncbi:hypothetical protein Pelo_4375 [Pelomyxa schiedti]|nr:hypothetical protein Pelo_4375 [Pelomyxa schiedti]
MMPTSIMERSPLEFSPAQHAGEPILARSQFLAVASSQVTERRFVSQQEAERREVVPGVRRKTGTPGTDRRAGVCYVSMLPEWIVVECIGKRWVLGTDRAVLVSFLVDAFDRGNRPDHCVLFSLSHTLGLIILPCRVSHWLSDHPAFIIGDSAVAIKGYSPKIMTIVDGSGKQKQLHATRGGLCWRPKIMMIIVII